MERPLWSGSLAFGIVTIPVRLVAATRDHDIHFHQISRADRKRIRYKKVAEGGEDEVADDDIVKGYAVKDGQYVVFDDNELARLAARKSTVIDISSFVQLSEIDPLYFDRPYRLLPDERGEKPYRLLAEVLERTGRIGIAQMVMRGKEHIVAIRSVLGMLILHTLRYQDEVVATGAGTKSAKSKAAGLSERELAMAEKLVESMAGEFDPGDFTDEYRDRLQAAINRKAKGKTLAIEEEETEPEHGKVINLMEALERSLGRQRKGAGAVKAKAKAGTRSHPARRKAG